MLRATSRQPALQSVIPSQSLRCFAACGTPRLALLLLGRLFSIGCAIDGMKNKQPSRRRKHHGKTAILHPADTDVSGIASAPELILDENQHPCGLLTGEESVLGPILTVEAIFLLCLFGSGLCGRTKCHSRVGPVRPG